jgi:polar amino acid transport system permease protein
MTTYFGDMIPYLPVFLQALLLSVWVTLLSFGLGSALGIVVYEGWASHNRYLHWVARAFVEVFRNTPLLVQLYLVYFGLPQLSINLNPFWATVVAMTLNNAAYTGEIFRAGVSAVPQGQWEAAYALGMNRRAAFSQVVLLPAVKAVRPALTNQFIILFLFSSVGSTIALPELTSALADINQRTLETLEVFTTGGLLYYLTSALFARLSESLGKRLLHW